MNINPLVQDAAGREIFAFGGQTAWKTASLKGYIVSLEWFIGRKSTEPIMMIQSERQGHDNGAFGICLSSIGKYADPSGGAAEGAEWACFQALPTLGKALLVIEARLLLDVILTFASDLILMPPAPMAIRRQETLAPVAEVELSNGFTGKTEREVTI